MFGDIVTDIPQPKDRKIMFKDIITSGIVNREKSVCLMEGTISKHHSENPLNEKHQEYLKSRETPKNFISLVYEENNQLRVKSNTIKGYDIVTENDCIDLSFPTSKTRRGRVTKGKSPCLMESQNNLYSYKDGIVRTVNKVEMCRLQGFPDDYCDILTTAKAGSLLGDGWTLPIIEHIFSFIKK
jgi:site-specific DNA-cytosine methylase